ncbi:MarR family winged helix-turn-helix transcriptional regulator [Microbacterium deminutum]|uniref:MarR family winged helix-turn-helix transcriptional regulator n=1 Tax=Microbacterium deminutum TaxID=344164 RepID=UPI0031D9AAAC
MLSSASFIDVVSLAGGASDAFVVRILEGAGFIGLRVRHGYVFQRLLVAPSSISELARDLGVTQQAMSKTIAELTSLGYVEASADPADARRRVVVLSDRGHGAVRAAREARRLLEARVIGVVGAQQVRAARETLDALLEELGLGQRVGAREAPIPLPSD